LDVTYLISPAAVPAFVINDTQFQIRIAVISRKVPGGEASIRLWQDARAPLPLKCHILANLQVEADTGESNQHKTGHNNLRAFCRLVTVFRPTEAQRLATL
jgi:hypothetical protein